ncbi:MAG: hypothetical protein CME64_01945 [Halobacteriovoraceae bacterium]|nr:hypothetical protein [Halobacteriovoraceae bacterium]
MKQKQVVTVKILCVACIPLLLFLPPSKIKRIVGECSRVLDGDTVEVDYGYRPLKIRLAFIDAPEKSQMAFDSNPIGLWSTQLLEQHCLGNQITVNIIQKDRYGRYLGEIFHEDRSLNLLMVEEGMALIYRNYTFQTISQKVDYFSAEISAKRKRLGVWRTFGFLDPHAHRRLKRRGHGKK